MSPKKDIKEDAFVPKIVVFACNWCSYAGADTAGVGRMQYTPHIRVIRMMCSGRIHPSFVFKAFEKGADGVLVTGCHFGDCHYISGNERAVEIFEIIENITDLIGIDKKRIGLEWISAAEGARFGQVMNEFVQRVTELGPLPKPAPMEKIAVPEDEFEPIRGFNALACYECGKCTGVCPVARVNDGFSPRRTIRKAIFSKESFEAARACLTCGLCDARCPQEIEISSLVAAVREADFQISGWGDRPHGGVFQAIGRLMTAPEQKPARGKWIPEDAEIDEEGDTLLYVGCAPYFDAFFTDLEVRTLDAARGALKILNSLDIKPRIFADERCCGHDFYWSGDTQTFRELAALNKEHIEKAGVRRIVFTCPECLSAFKQLYPQVGINIDAELMSMPQFVALNGHKLQWDEKKSVVTLQDPCRLARHLNETAAPRTALSLKPGLELREMSHSGTGSICCAGSWNFCDSTTKAIQKSRIEEAKRTGADMMVTACPKCEIHLKCSMKGADHLELRDLTALMGEAVKMASVAVSKSKK